MTDGQRQKLEEDIQELNQEGSGGDYPRTKNYNEFTERTLKFLDRKRKEAEQVQDVPTENPQYSINAQEFAANSRAKLLTERDDIIAARKIQKQLEKKVRQEDREQQAAMQNIKMSGADAEEATTG